jgi:hypothetical protein
MKYVSMVFCYLLLLAGFVMFAWGGLGFLEYFTGMTPLVPLQNPTFPRGTQFIHWLLISASGTIYLAGYFTRWKHTPFAMVVIYAMLATLCAVETFDFMTKPGRYGSFIRECIGYVGISIYLFRSQRMRTHFGQ